MSNWAKKNLTDFHYKDFSLCKLSRNEGSRLMGTPVVLTNIIHCKDCSISNSLDNRPFQGYRRHIVGVQNNWGKRKIYRKWLEKVGNLTLDNSRKVDFLQFLWITNNRHQLKEFANQIREMKSHKEGRKLRFWISTCFFVKPSRRSLENLEAFVWKSKSTISSSKRAWTVQM